MDHPEILRSVSSEVPDYIKKFLVECDDGSFVPITVPARFFPDILKMEIRPSDVVVVSWPKSGSRLKVIGKLLGVGKLSPPLGLTVFRSVAHPYSALLEDFSTHSDEYNVARYHLDAIHHYPIDLWKGFCRPKRSSFSKTFISGKGSKFVKVHAADKPLEQNAKLIYVVRNPKDAAVSFYNFSLKNSNLPPYKDWSTFFEHFCNGLLPYGDWFEHVLQWWEKRNKLNVLFIKYEDMKKDPKNVVRCVSEFLEKSVSEEELEDICEKTSFDIMKKTPNVSPDLMNIPSLKRAPIQFMRKGVIGDWKNYFTVAQNERFDELYRQKMEGSGLQLDFE